MSRSGRAGPARSTSRGGSGNRNGHEVASGRCCGWVLGAGFSPVLLPQEHDRVAVGLDCAFEIVGGPRRRRRSPRVGLSSEPESTSNASPRTSATLYAATITENVGGGPGSIWAAGGARNAFSISPGLASCDLSTGNRAFKSRVPASRECAPRSPGGDHSSDGSDAGPHGDTPAACDRECAAPGVGRSRPERRFRLRECERSPLPLDGPRQGSAFDRAERIRAACPFEESDAIIQGVDTIGRQAPAVNAVAVERFVYQPCDRTREQEPNRAFPVGSGPQRLVEPAGGGESRTADGRPCTEAALQDGCSLVFDRERAILAKGPDHAALVLEKSIRAKHVEMGARHRELAQSLKPCR